jgi:Fic family protein
MRIWFKKIKFEPNNIKLSPIMSRKKELIIEYISKNKNCSSTDISEHFIQTISLATVKRILLQLINKGVINKSGVGKNTRYVINNEYVVLSSIDIDEYYQKEVDERIIKKNFNFDLIQNVLSNINLFSKQEEVVLNKYQNTFTENVSKLTQPEYENEMERMAIDLSWKSSQIEGNTYTLLETEQLLKEKKTASGKTKDEAIMLLNHKEAIDFIVNQPNYMYPLTLSKIEDLHSILIKELAISKNIRTKRVAISGTNYLPIENEFQIKEALENMCNLVNTKDNVFEKALLALLLISYIQPFMDGNKRTARLVCNAILLHFKYCPLSFRTVDSLDYKKAILLFYEVNNITAFKKIFIQQYKFAVDTYF